MLRTSFRQDIFYEGERETRRERISYFKEQVMELIPYNIKKMRNGRISNLKGTLNMIYIREFITRFQNQY